MKWRFIVRGINLGCKMADRQVVDGDPYIEKLKKLVPTEVTAAFLAINSLVPLKSDLNVVALIAAAVLAVVCLLYLRRLQGVTRLSQLVFTSFVAFPVWAMNIMISRFDYLAEHSFIPSSVLILVTVIAPLVSPAEIKR